MVSTIKHKNLQINFDRLKERIIELSNIGKEDGGGIFRMAFRKEDYEERLWLLENVLPAMPAPHRSLSVRT